MLKTLKISGFCLAILFSIACAKPSLELEVELIENVQEHIIADLDYDLELLTYDYKSCENDDFWNVSLVKVWTRTKTVETGQTVSETWGRSVVFYVDKKSFKVVKVLWGQ